MKLNRASFLFIFLFILIGLVNNVTSEDADFDAETESYEDTTVETFVNSNEVDSQEINGDEIKADDDNNEENSSDENFEDLNSDFDLSTCVETTTTATTGGGGGSDMTGMQISTEQIAPIVNQLLGPLSATIQPYLGPLAPLSNVLGSVISHTVTEVVVNLLNETIASAKRQEFLQIRNYTAYTSYLVTIPNNGRFLLLSRTPASDKKPKRHRKNSKRCT